MKLRGFPSAGPPASYVSKPQGSIIGSSALKVSKIVAVPGNPGPPGKDGSVLSVNGREGHVELTKDDLELDQVDNTPDTEKPVSGPQLTAIELKLSRRSGANVVYVNGADGLPSGQNYTSAATNFTIVYRNGAGTFSIGTPTDNSHPATKQYADSKVAKNSTVNSAYGTDASGVDRMWLISSGATASSLALRSTGGVLTVGAPTADSHAATRLYVDTKVAGIVNSAPTTLDTLDELAAALGDDPNFATTVATQIGTKVDKLTGAYKVYATDGGGAQTSASWSFDPNPVTVVVRTDQGRITATAPAAATDVTNKQYVDSKLPWTGTQAQYDAIATKDPARLYVVTP